MIKVYYSVPLNGGKEDACFKRFGDDELMKAVNYCAWLRKEGYRHVTMYSEPDNIIGKMGVDSVENGKLPNGDDYVWKVHQ